MNFILEITREYTIEEMLKFQIHDEDRIPIVHLNTKKPYYIYELAEIYHQKIQMEKYHKKNADFVDNKIKSAFFKQGTRKKLFDEIDIDNILQMSRNGLSKRKIAKIYHCDEKTIRNYLKKTLQEREP